jgi:uncharacterized protein (TIGR03435 family)
MRFVRFRVLCVFVVSLFAAMPVLAQQAPAPTFEVATIKQNKSGDTLSGVQRQPGGRLTITNQSVRTMITFAYRITGYQVVGGPGWTDSDRFDVLAKIEGRPEVIVPGSLEPDSSQLALRKLLADRFKLKLHREMRELDVYALTMAKPGTRGPGLTPSGSDCAAMAEQLRQGKTLPPAARTATGAVPCSILGGAGRISFDGYGMAQVANMLIGQAGRMVVDRTGLSGSWQFVLTFAPEGATDSNAPSLFTALQEQLGLKLESGKSPVEVTVIDSIEHPTED